LPASVSVSDLVGAGLVGMSEALAAVDPDARANGEYLWYRVHLSMLAFAHARGDVLVMASLRLVQAIGRAACASGQAPDEVQIAAAMGLPCREYRVLLGALARARMTQLDLSLPPLPAPSAEPGRGGLAAEELAAALAVAMDELPSQLQQILALRHQAECTAGEIGAALDLSESRVLELEVEAIHRLRAGMCRG
jgi:RNA polymerase sigma factor (sigma-70 family)